MILGLKCTGCGAEYPADTLMNLCPVDQRPVEIIIDIDRLGREQAGLSWYQPKRRDLWRLGGLLALDIANDEDRQHIVTLGEGYTPVLDYSDYPLAKKAGFTLGVKDEGKAHPGFGGTRPDQTGR
jgi:threonine synthase